MLAIPLGIVGIGVVAILVLTLACLVALRQNRNLRFQLARAVAMITPNQGSIAPPLVGQDARGLEHVLSFQQDLRQTVVFTFSTDCPYCRPYWQTVSKLRKVAPRRLRIAYVDTHDRPAPSEQYLTDNGIDPGRVLISLSPVSALSYRALLLPQLELLDGSGRVQWSHAGEMTQQESDGLLARVLKEPNIKEGDLK
jgi:hypothetical protein